MAEGPSDQSPEEMAVKPSVIKQRKGFISPTSSFIDFGTLQTEYFSPEGDAFAQYYNPYDHRRLKRPTTDFECAVHLLKGSVGIGVLSMPMAFSHIGVAPGIVFTAFLTFICIYSMDTLLKMQYIQCKKLQVPFIPLPVTMKIAFKNGPRCLRCFASIAPCLVDFFLIAFQLGICTAYATFVATAIKKFVETKLIEEKINLKWYMLMIFIPVCLSNYIRDLKKLMPLSLCANILVIFSFICCFYYIFLVGEWKTDTVKTVAPVIEWPLFLGTVLFSLEAVGVVIAMEHNMEFPEHFLGKKGIFPWSLTGVAILYMFIGIIGYLKYGKDVKETIFECLPENEWFVLIIYLIYGLCIFLTYPLQCFVSLEILWGNYIRHIIKDPMKECFVEYLLRTVTVIVTFLFGCLIPEVDVIISLVGAFCISVLGLVLPFALELCTKWPNQLGFCYWTVIKTTILIILGFLILIMGTCVTLYTYMFNKKDKNE